MATETVKFNLRLPADLKAALEAQAALQDLSLNQLVVRVLRREVKAGQGPVVAPRAAPVRVPAKVVPVVKVGRNEPCPCGSGKKAKFCCPARTR